MKRRAFLTYNMAFFLVLAVLIGYVVYKYSFIKSAIEAVSCRNIKAKISIAVSNCSEHDDSGFSVLGRPYKAVNLYLLYKKGYLRNIVTCPAGGEYKFREDGTVYCSYHNREEERKF